MWTSHVKLEALVLNCWTNSYSLSNMAIGLKECGHQMKFSYSDNFGHLGRLMKYVQRQLARLQSCVQIVYVIHDIRTIATELNMLLKHEEVISRQRSSLHWLVDGDRKHVFFMRKLIKGEKIIGLTGLRMIEAFGLMTGIV